MPLDYGLDAELKAKADAKYDHGLEKEVTAWIEAIIGEKKGDEVRTDAEDGKHCTLKEMKIKYDGVYNDEDLLWYFQNDCKACQDFGAWLKDGRVLCKLANAIKPGSTKKVNESAMPFKQMENITYFMDAARKLGVPETSMFGTPDLYEAKNMGSVVSCLYTYAGIVQVKVPEFEGAKLGIAVTTTTNDKARDRTKTHDLSKGFGDSLEQNRPNAGVQGRGGAEQEWSEADWASWTAKQPAAAKASPKPAAAAGYSTGSLAASPYGQAPPKDDCAYGLDAELKSKQDAKYDVGLEGEVVAWIETVGGEKWPADVPTLQAWLKDGRILCQLANKVKPGCIAKVNTSTLAFKQMENITYFMTAARAAGVPEMAMFGTPDLYEDKNMGTVVKCIYMYGGAIQTSMPSFTGPKLGIPAADVKDKQRDKTGCVDQSGGNSKTMEVVAPKYGMKR